jgi:cytochrome c
MNQRIAVCWAPRIRPVSGVFFAALAVALAASATPVYAVDGQAALAIATKNNCLACHAVDSMVVGPAYRDIAKKYQGDASAPDKLFSKVRNGGTGVWGQVAMPPNPGIGDADLQTVIAWILAVVPEH